MTGRDELSDGRTSSRALVPGGSPRGSRPRGFAITDLLGLEAELPVPAGPGQGSGCEGPAAAPCLGPGLATAPASRVGPFRWDSASSAASARSRQRPLERPACS